MTSLKEIYSKHTVLVWIVAAFIIFYLYVKYTSASSGGGPPPLSHGSLLLNGNSKSIKIGHTGGDISWQASGETPGAKIQLYAGSTSDPTKASPMTVATTEAAASNTGVAKASFKIAPGARAVTMFIFANDLSAAAKKMPSFSNAVQVVIA